MWGARSRRKPTFLWQGTLILLPVAVMSAVGLISIRRDKAAVEHEAAQRANELVNQLASGLAKRVPAGLAAYDLFSFTWFKHQVDLATRSLPAIDTYEPRLAEWQAANPGLRPEEVLPNRLSFKSDGALVWPPGYTEPPQAPGWFLGLSARQRQAWDALVGNELRPEDWTNSDPKLRAFLDDAPPPEGRVCADFIWLRTRLAREAGRNAVTALLREAGDYPAVRNESGLPLLSLAAAEAIRLVRETDEAPSLLSMDSTDSGNIVHQILGWIINEPSPLSPLLLDQLEAVINSRAVGPERSLTSIRAARMIWSSQEHVRELSEALRHYELTSHAATNFWLATSSGMFFCRAEPEELSFATRDSADALVRQTNTVCTVRIYPETVVERAFASAIQELGVSLPDYFKLQVRLENEPVSFPPASRPTFEPVPAGSARSNSTRRGTNAPAGSAVVLAEAQGRFAPGPASFGTAPPPAESAQPIQEPDVAPQFAVQIRLVDAPLLFATQRQRTFLFGGLILASGLAAVVGLIAAYRSFRRQLRLSELKSDFVSSVSHELRAPIASVRLMAESLERGKIAEPRKQHEYFQFIVQECRRLSSLIENVLDFSRIEQGRKQFEFAPTDIVALTQQTVKLMEAYATERQVTLSLASVKGLSESGPLPFTADGKAVQQALINLIDNAVKHSTKGQSVTVGLEVRNAEYRVRSRVQREKLPCVALWVEDHGEGIPAEEHEKIFERFYRLGSELRRQTQGVGIGLSIVKHVVEAHGGRVEVRSQVGQGSRFTMLLPLEAETTGEAKGKKIGADNDEG